MMDDGLRHGVRRALIDILSASPHVERVVLFGSRARGDYRPGSDIDIAVSGGALTLSELLRLKEQIDETTIPQFVDLVWLEGVDDRRLRRNIEAEGVEWWSRSRELEGNLP